MGKLAPDLTTFLQSVHWLGHAGFRIQADQVIYLDPFQLKGGPPADLIFITHEHFDHCSPEDVRRIQKQETLIVTVAACRDKLAGEIRVIRPGERLALKGLQVEAVPAYNLAKKFHPRSAGMVGYILTVGGLRVYHAGDTDFTPEMAKVKADITLLPVGGTYTMDAAEAAQAANTIKPRLAIPMHWGTIVGSRKDAEQFKRLCQIPIEILEAGR